MKGGLRSDHRAYLKEHLTKSVLGALYWDHGLMAREIGHIFNVSKFPILTRMKEWDIPRRDKVSHLCEILSTGALHRLHWEFGLSERRISKMYDVSRGAVRHLMGVYEIQSRDRVEATRLSRSGPRSNWWTNGWTKVIITRDCKLCGEEFETTKRQTELGYGKFCSTKCAGTYNYGRMKTKWTLPERLVYSYLSSRYGLTFIPQYCISGYGVADFYNPWLRMIVECQGDYWHSLPRSRERDRHKRQFALDGGYQLVELWESDIKERFQKT